MTLLSDNDTVSDNDTLFHDGSRNAGESGSALERRGPDSSSTSLPQRRRKSINRATFFAQPRSRRAEFAGGKVSQQ
jgi:hypothetical protein